MNVQALRDLARRADELCGQVRAVGDDVAGADGVVWQSVGAERYRRDLRDEARSVQVAADELARAATALRAHAEEVEYRLAQVAAMQEWFLGALDDAQRTLSNVAEGAVDTVSDGAQSLVEAARSMPSPGSLAGVVS